MNIVLNRKDADFIANFIRGLMMTLDQNYKTITDDMNSKVDACEKLTEIFGAQNDEKIQAANKSLRDTSDKAIKSLQDEYNIKREELERALMLVMTGSENS